MKTLVIRKGERLTIRAIATPTDDPRRDRCATLAFFQEHAGLRPKEFEKLSALLNDTAKNGPPPDETKFKDLPGTDDLYEFKTSGGLRLICFKDEGSLIICTHGYLKDGQKLPKREKERAEKLKTIYFQDKKAGTLTHAEPKKPTLRKL
jgi:mRNA-degrading endonuclease RelE of RelBE toxin-antitoxin system